MPTSAARIELTAANGTTIVPLKLVAVEREEDGRVVAEHQMAEALSASDADSPLADWLEPEIQETWIGGCGPAYNAAPGCITWIGDEKGGYVMPGPLENGISIAGANNTNTPIRAIETFGGSGTLFALQEGTAVANTPRILRESPALTFGEVYTVPAANNTLNDLLVFDNGAWGGVKHLWASGNDATGGRLYSSVSGAAGTWAATASGVFGANRRDWLAKQFWTTGGVGAWRMVAGNGGNRISYTTPFSDPALAASWVEGVSIETSGTIRRPAVARQALWIPSQDGLFWLDEQGNTHNLMSDLPYHPWNGYATLYHDGWVYMGVGQGLTRVWVADGPQLQELPGNCTPGAYTAAEHEFGGFCTALASDQGWVVAAFFNPNTLRAAIWWGKDRRHFPGVETGNPMVWHGPAIVSNNNQWVTKMRPRWDHLNNALRLWVGSIPYDATATNFIGGAPAWTWFSLPVSGQPLSDMLTSGAFKFATGSTTGNWMPYNRLYSRSSTWGDKNSKKILHQFAAGNRGVSAADQATIRIFQRADPLPGSTTWGAGVDITTGVTQTIEPSATTSGHKLEWRADFFAVNGAASPPKVGLLDAVRWTAWRVAPAFRVLTLTVEYPTEDGWDPEQIKTYLKDLTESTRTTLRMPNDRRYTVKLRQVLDSTETLAPDSQYGKVIQTRVQLAVLAGPL